MDKYTPIYVPLNYVGSRDRWLNVTVLTQYVFEYGPLDLTAYF